MFIWGWMAVEPGGIETSIYGDSFHQHNSSWGAQIWLERAIQPRLLRVETAEHLTARSRGPCGPWPFPPVDLEAWNPIPSHLLLHTLTPTIPSCSPLPKSRWVAWSEFCCFCVVRPLICCCWLRPYIIVWLALIWNSPYNQSWSWTYNLPALARMLEL